MTRTEKVRGLLEQLQEALEGSVFAPLNEITGEALSLLEGHVIVPREATDDMLAEYVAEMAFTETPPAQQVWSAMIAASEGE